MRFPQLKARESKLKEQLVALKKSCHALENKLGLLGNKHLLKDFVMTMEEISSNGGKYTKERSG